MMTDHEHPTGSLTELPVEECLALLDTTTVGRIAFVNGEGQQLIPVNFALIDGNIYFRTTPDGVLAGLAGGHEDIAFGVDHSDEFRQGWNVTVRGTAEEARDRATVETVAEHIRLRPWAGGVRPLVIRVTPRFVAGRRVKGNAT
jgi:nitroimidazol reductase NimA-like FMN-containing flavoprotein (pyridoxamine 5'-phosphate oxidase superfamily)